MEIEWRDVVGYEGKYKVSNTGLVKSCERKIRVYHRGYDGFRVVKEQLMKTGINNMGYEWVSLRTNNKGKTCFVHRLVAQAFIPNPNNLPYINHKDENPLNNQVDNLEWCSPKYNCNFGNRNIKISKKRIGMKFTKEHIDNMRKAKKLAVTDEFREKMRQVHLGTTLTDEHRKKISEGLKRHYSK